MASLRSTRLPLPGLALLALLLAAVLLVDALPAWKGSV